MTDFLPILLVINVFSFAVFAIDKYYSIKKKRRISENTLLMLTAFGGLIGSALSMFFFNHKIAKKSFMHQFYIIVVVEIIFIALIYKFFK